MSYRNHQVLLVAAGEQEGIHRLFALNVRSNISCEIRTLRTFPKHQTLPLRVLRPGVNFPLLLLTCLGATTRIRPLLALSLRSNTR